MKLTGWKVLAGTTLLVFATSLPATALPITPGDASLQGDHIDEPSILAYLNGLNLGVNFTTDLLYKSDDDTTKTGPPDFNDSGPFKDSYDTVFDPAGDAGTASITHLLGTSYITGSPLYLLVKDGNHSPVWYLVSLTALGWDGTEDLELTGFWPGGGAISHVSIYGGSASVPDGGSAAALLGSALLGLGLLRRRFGRG